MKVPVFDPNDPAQLDDLLGTWRRLRDHAPVQHTPIAGGTWLLTRFDDIKRLLRDAEALMKPPGLDPGAPLTGGPAERIYRGLMVPGPGHATPVAALRVQNPARQGATDAVCSCK